VFPNLTVSVEYRLETISPCAGSLVSIICQYDFTDTSKLMETMKQRNLFEIPVG
jgi:hypothetical protein